MTRIWEDIIKGMTHSFSCDAENSLICKDKEDDKATCVDGANS